MLVLRDARSPQRVQGYLRLCWSMVTHPPTNRQLCFVIKYHKTRTFSVGKWHCYPCYTPAIVQSWSFGLAQWHSLMNAIYRKPFTSMPIAWLRNRGKKGIENMGMGTMKGIPPTQCKSALIDTMPHNRTFWMSVADKFKPCEEPIINQSVPKRPREESNHTIRHQISNALACFTLLEISMFY